eukprot:9139966-Ditylum_brightwellii.AAC.1
MPSSSSTNAATHAALNLIDVLQNPAPASPFANIGHNKIDALNKLAEIFVESIPKTLESKLIYQTKPPQSLQTHPMRTRLYQPPDMAGTKKDNPDPVPRVWVDQGRLPRVTPTGVVHANVRKFT